MRRIVEVLSSPPPPFRTIPMLYNSTDFYEGLLSWCLVNSAKGSTTGASKASSALLDCQNPTFCMPTMQALRITSAFIPAAKDSGEVQALLSECDRLCFSLRRPQGCALCASCFRLHLQNC